MPNEASSTNTPGSGAEASPASSGSPANAKAVTPTSSTPGKARKKRRRTRSHNSSPSPGRGFFIPGFELGQGNNMMSLSDVMDAAKGITNMYLAHEIAVNKDFMIQDLKQQESPLEKQVWYCHRYVTVGIDLV